MHLKKKHEGKESFIALHCGVAKIRIIFVRVTLQKIFLVWLFSVLWTMNARVSCTIDLSLPCWDSLCHFSRYLPTAIFLTGVHLFNILVVPDACIHSYCCLNWKEPDVAVLLLLSYYVCLMLLLLQACARAKADYAERRIRGLRFNCERDGSYGAKQCTGST